jgi:prevent-host-death family protein
MGVDEMLNTHVRAVRDLRNNYPELAKIIKDHNQVIITNNGKEEAVLISFEDYAAYEEFLHLRYVDKKLAEAEAEANDPATKWLSHDEVWEKIRSKYGI